LQPDVIDFYFLARQQVTYPQNSFHYRIGAYGHGPIAFASASAVTKFQEFDPSHRGLIHMGSQNCNFRPKSLFISEIVGLLDSLIGP